MKKDFRTFEEIDYELKRLDLERQIAWEEMKGLKGDFKEDIQPLNWIQALLNVGIKYGAFALFKRLF
ncbi:hypothetical protein [Formosa sp. S-31]|uniref:hypothetical protein n=1 Tax=Formosa sp. S-31 TaxID=2790949 RepID=UPI003EB7363F